MPAQLADSLSHPLNTDAGRNWPKRITIIIGGHPLSTITHRNADMVRVARDPDAGRRTTRMAVNVGEALLYHTKNSCLQLSREPA